MQERKEDTTPSMPHNASGHFLMSLVKTLVIGAVIAFSVRYFIAQPFIVRGASMEPTFEDNEYIIIDEVSYRLRDPGRGEVIVFRYPKNPWQFFIKRIIGLPGERVEIHEGQVRIINQAHPDGFVLPESYLVEAKTYPDISSALGPDQFFVMGDHRSASSDSRVWGPLPRRLITGRAFLRVLPLERSGMVGAQ